VFDNTMKGLSA